MQPPSPQPLETARHIGVVGGGLVGLASSLALQARFPDAHITVWEKETSVGQHQSTHNSGVLHAGLYYQPGSLKARLAVQGIRAMTEFAREHGIAHELCGKLVLAVRPEELPRLRELQERGQRNGLRGLRWIPAEEIAAIEPHATGLAALHVPEEGIIDYHAVVEKMSSLFTTAGGRLHCGTQVRAIRLAPHGWTVVTDSDTFACDFLLNCAGLHSDRVARLAGDRQPVRIMPFRGEYYELAAHRRHLVRNLIYPVPDPAFPFLGVHFTRLVSGGIEAGPNAVLALAREGYSKWQVNPRDLAESLTYPGLWRFMFRHGRMCLGEIHRSFHRSAFCQALQRMVPEIQPSDLRTGGSGVRAQALQMDGTLVQDFALRAGPNSLHILNAPSPAATASLAIGVEIASLVAEQFAR